MSRTMIHEWAWLVVGPKGGFLSCNLKHTRSQALKLAAELRAHGPLKDTRFKVVRVVVTTEWE